MTIDWPKSKKKLESFFPNTKEPKQTKKTTKGLSCEACGLQLGCKTPQMPPTGEGLKKVLILAEANGYNEDEQGKQLVGDAGQLFREKLSVYGLDLDRDFWKTNSITCFLNSRIKVFTLEGYKEIRNIKIGDLVLTHKGRFKKVLSRTWDLAKPLQKYKGDVFYVAVGRVNNPHKQYTGSKNGGFLVTSNHKFLTRLGWVEINKLKVGDKIVSLGVKCLNCSTTFYKDPSLFEKTGDFCCSKCQMEYSYNHGTRNPYKVTEEAHKKIRQLIKEGKSPFGNIPKSSRKKARINSARSIQIRNEVENRQTVGLGEREVGKYFSSEKIEFISQYAIDMYNFDFYLPKHNLLIEVDNPKRIGQKKFEERQQLKTNIALSHGFPMVRISSDYAVNSIKRLLKNHTNSYCFVEAEITRLEKRKSNIHHKIYCVEVEEDNSFVAKGVINHNCRPPNNREPSLRELRCCRHYLDETIQKYNPTMIWVMGGVALQSILLNKNINKETITAWRRRCIPDAETNAWIIPLLHPSFMLRNRGNKNVESVYDRDLLWATKLIGRDHPKIPTVKDKIVLVCDFDNLMEVIKKVKMKAAFEPFPFIFDYETTAIKPRRQWNKVVSISFYLDGKAYSFPYQYPGTWSQNQSEIIKKEWISILEDPNLLKVAHNLIFEDNWSSQFFVRPTAWHWDTMVAQHVLDDRAGTTGLKLQAYFRWGIIGYDSLIDPYKEEVSGTFFNRMAEAPLRDLLEYGATDSLLEAWLYEEQQKEFNQPNNRSLKKANVLFQEGIQAFADMQQTGIRADINYYLKKNTQLGRQITKLESELDSSEESELFLNKMGTKLSWTSNQQISSLLFKCLNIRSTKQTKLGNDSVDAEALDDYLDKVPILQKLKDKRKLEKLKGTYLAQFMREIEDDGRIYPISNLHMARTFRSSVNSPSFQNIPIRDKESAKVIRMGLLPSMGNKILEADFSGLEVHILPCYSKDPVLIDYLTKGGDMHKDQAKLLFKLPEEEITKDIRFEAKNKWVFAQFYGSYFVNCAKDLWKDAINKLNTASGKPLRQHLEDKRILTYQAFENHCKGVEADFWDLYKISRGWQDGVLEFYQKRGCVELFHGFRRAGLLDRNKLYNTPIQGSAFHCLLWCLIQLNKIRKEEGWVSKIMQQIHDSILWDLYPPEEKHIIETIHDVTTNRLIKAHPWINVPMDIEIEMAEVDQPWFTKHPIDLNLILKS